MSDTNSIIGGVDRLKRDMRAAAVKLSEREVRFLVDQYYIFQQDRLRATGRIRAMSEEASAAPHSILSWLESQSETLEQQILGALDRYSRNHPIGAWMRSITGVGPVIAAGFLAHLDIERAETAGSFWAVCGLDPNRDKRVRGKKLQYNPSLKRLCFLLGESFKRLNKHPKCYYGHKYQERKKYEEAKNLNGDYAELAKQTLEAKNFKGATVARSFYEKGQLPPARIDRRSCRWATKLFLAHLHQIWYEHHFAKAPPLPYPIRALGHKDIIVPPGAEMPEEWAEHIAALSDPTSETAHVARERRVAKKAEKKPGSLPEDMPKTKDWTDYEPGTFKTAQDVINAFVRKAPRKKRAAKAEA